FTGPNPSRSLALYAAAGVLHGLYPEVGCQLGERRGHSGSYGRSWLAHALLTSDRVPGHRPHLRWAAVLMGSGACAGDLGCGEVDRSPPERALLRSAALLERLRSSRARIRD